MASAARIVALLAVLALVVAAAACNSDNGGTQALTFTTFNAGLAYNFVPLSAERR